jgi:Winged helix DNA-binding domain
VAEERILTQRELNRALLARQLLLERARTPLPRALERIGGIQAQYAPAMYIGLWSRLDGFERDALTRALQRRSVVQGTLLRATIHLVSARDYWPFAVAVRRARRESWAESSAARSSTRRSAGASRG